MPKHLHIAVAIFIIALLASCGDDRCEGSLIVVNTIPDITMAVGDTVYIDLTTPRVFESPPNNAISYAVSPLSGFGIVQVLQMQNENENDNERATIIRIIGKSSGNAKVLVEAGTGCLVNETTFNITVQ